MMREGVFDGLDAMRGEGVADLGLGGFQLGLGGEDYRRGDLLVLDLDCGGDDAGVMAFGEDDAPVGSLRLREYGF